jgi:hypothetical protein|tara:strand:+ start:127 stop:324 length:198 start_codon:yes stop_codon:yes gene_type:complete
MKSFSPQDIARQEVLDILQAHTEKGAYRDRFGPEEKDFTEMKRRELAIILNDLADQWGYIGYKED